MHSEKKKVKKKKTTASTESPRKSQIKISKRQVLQFFFTLLRGPKISINEDTVMFLKYDMQSTFTMIPQLF